ncbi:MAG: hypothetical protein A2451_08380 [Bdellovibrionales bacterium RIFOXYC2_FULL_39_8]|nr:MAG: hypothetical protein A2451_08380 [Bdellovibrionales bacterium RIFOXYC2_FULL_39_8]
MIEIKKYVGLVSINMGHVHFREEKFIILKGNRPPSKKFSTKFSTMMLSFVSILLDLNYLLSGAIIGILGP